MSGPEYEAIIATTIATLNRGPTAGRRPTPMIRRAERSITAD